MRMAALAALLILGGALSSALAGCSPSGSSVTNAAQASDPRFAGLDNEILNWRKEIIATDPLCQGQTADQKCESFEVACKAQRTVTPADQAKGVTGKVVAMITWNGFDQKFKHPQSGTQVAEFTKTGSGWTRAPHKSVYMQSCGDM
jgi:hypothetical protein